jgi:hypothetical protein
MSETRARVFTLITMNGYHLLTQFQIYVYTFVYTTMCMHLSKNMSICKYL